MRLRILLFASVALWPTLAVAVEPDEILSDPVLETRARNLSSELRCLVCQNQSIDDSAAPLAKDLRVIVRERLKAGDDDAQVRDYLVQRYGDFILLKPPFKIETLLLWLTPALVLVGGGAALVLFARRRRQGPAPASLSDAEEGRLAEILSNETDRANPPVV
ncbi:MAG: ccmH [Hyphomicrobiales bacterium]|jgi:cytochrome c-type biogenesis protein CcmH|nr:ccmH [Hyphomicrobiales bacterium]